MLITSVYCLKINRRLNRRRNIRRTGALLHALHPESPLALQPVAIRDALLNHVPYISAPVENNRRSTAIRDLRTAFQVRIERYLARLQKLHHELDNNPPV